MGNRSNTSNIMLQLNSPPFRELSGKMIIDIINMFAGFSGSFGGFSPYLRSIKFIHYSERKEHPGKVSSEILEEEIDFYRLFYSYPPFEPISYPPVKYNDVEFYGNRLWLLKVREWDNVESVENFLDYVKKALNRELYIVVNPRDNIMFFGEYEDYGEEIFPLSIFTFSIVGKKRWFLRLRFLKEGRKYSIIYGMPILKKYLSCRDPLDVDSKKLYMALMKAKHRCRYRPEYLNYITWCYGGSVVNTDPVAPGEGCPKCSSSKRYSRRYKYLCYDAPGGKTYYYSRKIFPKVISIIKNDLDFRATKPLVPFSVEVFASRRLESKVENFSLTLPRGRTLILTPVKKPFTILRKTNGLLITISERFVKALVHFMERYSAYHSDKLNKDFNLLHLLVTKFLVRDRPFDLAQAIHIRVSDSNDLQIDVGELIKKVKEYINRKKYLEDGFTRFVGLTLAHTLAHVMLMLVSEELNLSLDDLMYVYGVKNIRKGDDDFSEVFYAAVVEKNEIGTLQINMELSKIFGNDPKKSVVIMGEKLRKFWERTCDTLEEYQREFEKISSEVKDTIRNDKKIAVLEYVAKEILYELLRNGFLPDSDMIKQILTNVIPSSISDISRIARTKFNVSIDRKELEDLVERYIDDIATYLMDEIDPCFDGCNLDIRLDKQCSEALFENLYVSRKLLELFLKVAGIVSERLEVNGEGLFNLIAAAGGELYIKTAFISTQAIYALERILREGVKITLELDKRVFNQFAKELGRLARRYRNFKFKSTDVPHHGKALKVDVLDVITSWNYSTSGHPLQEYEALLKG